MKKSFAVPFCILLFTFHISHSQNLSAYVNIRNEFYSFEDSFSQQLDYLPPLSYKIGGNCIAYVDNRGTFHIYQFGSKNTPINGVVGSYEVTNDLVMVRTGSLYAFDEGELHLLTRFIGPYVYGDSVVGFIDYGSRNLSAYYNGKVREIKQGTSEAAATFITSAGNLFAYTTYDKNFCIYYHDSVYTQETEFPQDVSAGIDVVAYTDQYEPGFRVFYKGVTKTIEEFTPQKYFVANDLIAYITKDGDFKIFYAGNVYNMGNYSISKLLVKDNLVLYSDRLNYLFAFYNGKSYQLENFIPAGGNISQNTAYYYDQSNRLKIFQAGVLTEMPMETYLTINNDYDVVKMQMQGSRFRFFSGGKIY